MDRRDRSLARRLEELEARVKALELQLRPISKDRDGIIAVLTAGQKVAGLLVVGCAVAGVVLQVVR